MKYLVDTISSFHHTYEVEAESEEEANDFVNTNISSDELEACEVEQEWMGEYTILARKKL